LSLLYQYHLAIFLLYSNFYKDAIIMSRYLNRTTNLLFASYKTFLHESIKHPWWDFNQLRGNHLSLVHNEVPSDTFNKWSFITNQSRIAGNRAASGQQA
jgi:hypothetical protein